MSFSVRIAGHRGVTRFPVTQAVQSGNYSTYTREWPTLWSQTVSLTTDAVQQTTVANVSPDTTRLITVEIPSGQGIRYEISTSAANVKTATQNSPELKQGTTILAFGAGWIMSLFDAGFNGYIQRRDASSYLLTRDSSSKIRRRSTV